MGNQAASMVNNTQGRTQEWFDTTNKQAAVFIDVENFYFCRKDLYEKQYVDRQYEIKDLRYDLKHLIDWIRGQLDGMHLTVLRGYASFTKWFPVRDARTGKNMRRPLLQDAVDELIDLGIEPVLAPALTGTKNAVDMRIAIDASSFVGSLTKRAILVAADSDYVPVILHLRRLGVEVVVVGFGENFQNQVKYLRNYLRSFSDRLYVFEEFVKKEKTEVEEKAHENVPHDVPYYKMILEGVEPRFVIVPREHWIVITAAICQRMHQGPASLKEVADDVRGAMTEDAGEASGSVTAVMSQLRDSDCFTRLKNGTASPGRVDQWQSDVGLAVGVDSPEEMRKRTRDVIISTLERRLKDLGDRRPVQDKVIHEMLGPP